MRCTDLTIRQAHALGGQIRPRLGYLGKLRRRMELVGFPPDDPLYRAAREAQEAVQDLHVRAHYLGCPHGVGEQPK